MANTKDKGNDGKRRKPCRSGKKLSRQMDGNDRVPPVNTSCEPQLASGFRGNSIFCFFGHELVRSGLSATLENCVGNLYPGQGDVCLVCGVCSRFISTYLKGENLEASMPILYPQKPVEYRAEVHQ